MDEEALKTAYTERELEPATGEEEWAPKETAYL
jgi:hypothetical protein